MEPGMFLSPAEVAELTGIKTGRNGLTREAMQAAQLRLMGIPFHENARGRPIIARAMIEGRSHAAVRIEPRSWSPKATARGA